MNHSLFAVRGQVGQSTCIVIDESRLVCSAGVGQGTCIVIDESLLVCRAGAGRTGNVHCD